MKASEHPEYDRYWQDRHLVERCRRAVAAWRQSGESLPGPVWDGKDQPWTPQRARVFVLEVAGLFRAYNRVLWQAFSYCRDCRGGCCVVGASHVTPFDALALALLDEPFPQAPQRAGTGDCIYLASGGCTWPAAWRPLKCWAFYCLGSGDWELDASDERYRRITEALEDVVRAHLPHWLDEYQERQGRPFHTFLTDPLAFAEKLGAALVDLFVAPVEERYPLGGGIQEQAPSAGTADAALAFIAEAAAETWARPGPAPQPLQVSAEQFLADLELLEWCLLTRPGPGEAQLEMLEQRYAAAAPPVHGEPPSLWYRMARHVAALRRKKMDKQPTRG